MALKAPVWVFALVAALTVSGCGTSAANSPAPAGNAFADRVEAALADATAADATPAQIQAIRAAGQDGSVNLETVASAIAGTFDCFDAAGVHYESKGSHVDGGVTYIDYVYEAGNVEELAEACVNQNSYYIEMLYALQPSTIDAADAAFVAAMPQLVECLRGLGVALDDDVTADELKQLIPLQQDEIGTAGEESARDRTKCVVEAGITGF